MPTKYTEIKNKTAGGEPQAKMLKVAKKRPTTSSSGASIDKRSVLNTGYGPLSGSGLAKKVASGQIKMTKTGNKITASRTTPTTGTGSIKKARANTGTSSIKKAPSTTSSNTAKMTKLPYKPGSSTMTKIPTHKPGSSKIKYL